MLFKIGMQKISSSVNFQFILVGKHLNVHGDL